ncbi:MAG: hypothetical protein EBZ36_11620 [Acidobacteria bacterium]|nr:hypothetical protein [Acidobacteriota bacterium]
MTHIVLLLIEKVVLQYADDPIEVLPNILFRSSVPIDALRRGFSTVALREPLTGRIPFRQGMRLITRLSTTITTQAT